MTTGVLAAYRGLVCDLDGVVFRGSEPVPGTGDALRDVVAAGGVIAYATNNSSRTIEATTATIADRGSPVEGQHVLTSAVAGAAAIRAELDAGARVLALGGEGVVEALSLEGLESVPPAFSGSAEIGAGVLQGYGPELRSTDFATGARWLASGVTWVATNTDATLPVEWGEAPGNGAYVALLERTVRRRARAVGKPAPDLYDVCLDRLGVAPAQVLAIGDRLETDIDGALAAGIDSALVLTGVSRPVDVLALAPERRPTFVADSLASLALPYAAPAPLEGGGASCGASVVRVEGAEVVVEPGDSPAELTRAVLLAWDLAAGGPPVEGRVGEDANAVAGQRGSSRATDGEPDSLRERLAEVLLQHAP